MTTIVEFYIPNKIRKNTIKSLINHFDNDDCNEIEKGIYDMTEQYCKNDNNITMAQSIYNDCLNNLIYNLDQNNETIKKIKKLIKKKKFNPYNLAFLRPEELDENNWAKIILRKNTTEYQLKNLPTIEWKSCYVCHTKEYSFYQLQTRSADEPMTTFYICKTCGKTYKVNN